MLSITHDSDTDRWRLSTTDLSSLTSQLGKEVVIGFARCFLHADRITSLISMAQTSETKNGADSVAFERDLSTVVWFVAGTLREMAISIRALRSALAKNELLAPDTPAWRELRAVESRWEDQKLYRDLRNLVAFHIDEEIVRIGLESMESLGNVVFVEGESELTSDLTLKLGLETIYQGLELSLDQFVEFLEAVGDDQLVAITIQQAFVDLIQSEGIDVADEL